MKIHKVTISNWRSIKFESVSFQDLVILIGQNNHGKSNILSALLFFFGHINIAEMDFNSQEDELFVEITFSHLTEDEKSTFKKYIRSDGTLMVRKTANDEGVSYQGYIQEPDELWLREANCGDYTSRDKCSGLPLYKFLPEAGRVTKEMFITAQQKYIQENTAAIKFSEMLEVSNFMGARNVAKGIFGELYFVPSIKNASDEFHPRGNTLFGNLYSGVIQKMSENNAEFKEAKEKITQLSSILNKTLDGGKSNEKRPAELTELEQVLEDELKRWDTKIDVQIVPPNVEEIFRLGARVLVDDGIKTEVDRKGHGLQRAIIFALMKSWAKLSKAARKKAEEEADSSQNSGRHASTNTFFIFEEPELFLHPQAQKELFASLVELSKNENQIIICTHSSAFIDLEYHRSICIVKKDDLVAGTKVLQCQEEIFTSSEEKKKFNMIYWINPDRSELFFAKKVILVEGQTDKSVIPFLAKNMGVYRYEFTIIDCGSKDNIPSYVKLLNKFRIKYTVVFDKDNQSTKTVQAIQSANSSSEAITREIDERFGNFVIFENDIEEEIGLTGGGSGKPFAAVQHLNSLQAPIATALVEKIKKIFL